MTGGLLALVYGFTKAGTDGWGSSVTVGLFAAAAVLLVAFVVIEQRVSHPLLPLRVVLDRNRGGSFLASLLVGTALLGHLPVADLLLPGHAALLGPQVRVRLRALLGRHHHRRHRWPAACCPASGPGSS